MPTSLKPIPTRPLGRTGITVTALGFGSAPLGDIYDVLDDSTALATAKTATQAGITLFDTAPFYGQGCAEHRVGTALRRHTGAKPTLSTKVGRLLKPAPQGRTRTSRFVGGLEFDVINDYSYDAALRSHEDSLQRLGVPAIDILLIHDADAWGHGPEDGPKRYREAMEGAYKALQRLKEEGAIKAIGVGLNDADYVANFLRDGDFDCVLMAGRYSLLEQPALAEVLPLAQDKGVGVMLGGVYNSGILATGAVEDARYNYLPAPDDILEKVRRIEAVCQSHNVPLATAALHFCLGHPAVSSLVLGAVTPNEVQQNRAAIVADVPPSLWSDLKSEGLLDASAPTPQ